MHSQSLSFDSSNPWKTDKENKIAKVYPKQLNEELVDEAAVNDFQAQKERLFPEYKDAHVRRGEDLYRRFRKELFQEEDVKNDKKIRFQLDGKELVRALEYWKLEAYENFVLLMKRLGFVGVITVYSFWGMMVSDRSSRRVSLPSIYDAQAIAAYFRLYPEKVFFRLVSIACELAQFSTGLLVDLTSYRLFGPNEEKMSSLAKDGHDLLTVRKSEPLQNEQVTYETYSVPSFWKDNFFHIFHFFRKSPWPRNGFPILQRQHFGGKSPIALFEEQMKERMKRKYEFWEWKWQRRASKLREMLTRLGPAFIKFGQTLASRPDIVGHYGVVELQKLQDSLPFFSTERAFEFITEELGATPDQIFDFISKEPAAAASLGQVYKARLDNVDVAVKVQRPDIAESIALDSYILRGLAFTLTKLLKSKTDFVMAVDEFGTRLYEEIDYKGESSNMIRFQKLYGDIPGIYIPSVFQEYSTRRILVMEWIDGQKIVNEGNFIRKEDAALVEIGIQFSLKQLLETGFLHADPHGGNLVRMKDGRLAYLDFGLVSHVPEAMMYSMICTFFHLMIGDYPSLAEDFASLALIQSNDLDNHIPELILALQETFSQEPFSFHGLPEKLVLLASRFPFVIPPYFLNNLRALSTLESLARTADTSFDVKDVVYPYVVSRMLYDPAPQLQHALENYIIDRESGSPCWDRIDNILHDAVVASIHSQSHIVRSYLRTSSLSGSGSYLGNMFSSNEEELTAYLLISFLISPGGSFLRELLVIQFARNICRYLFYVLDRLEFVLLPDNLRPPPAASLLSISTSSCNSMEKRKDIKEATQRNRQVVMKLFKRLNGYHWKTSLFMVVIILRSILRITFTVVSFCLWRVFRDVRIVVKRIFGGNLKSSWGE
ncbi:aarF domain-containing kinase [Galdieria sulphuraria]|uniref:AarF domain-containing kinase n=1 Tax=Galdieria sulphuraria TaxID=130081 RepID=M2XY29_GALSU|nr:aarF domain-containing kinase [Galdieria sulphuraria]EME28548.1 aarF domain-containing kinase [Galdieria sulphuraria]|eukprot:XP_005705068.1 aarF domain-containing kinase [Galdieria sulphuraria]